MADTSDFRNGMVIELDGKLWQITYFQHVKPGKGGAFVRTKLKDVMDGGVVDRTFRAGEKVNEVRLERRPVQFSYADGEIYYFMNMETFELIPISADSIGEEQLQYLQENMECEGLYREGEVLAVELPQFVELEVAETDPGVRGDTAQGGTKPAKLVTGAVVQVPLFVERGEVIRVDRTEDKYITRVTTS
ncbi:MAG: elongation factor P [Gemmatimonadota bacterium]|nr:elongation factor P [Gemmatimonadota bacterium]